MVSVGGITGKQKMLVSLISERDSQLVSWSGGYKHGEVMSRDYDHTLKLLLIGDSGVGKSSLLLRFAEDRFPQSHLTTIGVDFKLRTLEVDGQRVRLQVWDTAGQERFRTITSTYYRGTHGVLVIYDVTNGDSFASVKRWMHEVGENCEQRVCSVLVGNKDDDPSCKVVEREDAERFAGLMGVPLFETSAKENRNVEEVFLCLVREVLRLKRQRTLDLAKPDHVLKLSSKRRHKKKRC